jgi:hypothetical protein
MRGAKERQPIIKRINNNYQSDKTIKKEHAITVYSVRLKQPTPEEIVSFRSTRIK